MRDLIPLRLPLLVEARKIEGEDMSLDFLEYNLNLSRSSSSSDLPSPVTPTFSLQGHLRFPSSTSSLASSPVIRESMDGFASAKRPLTDVKEEPIERDDEYEVLASPEVVPDCEYDLSMDIIQTRLSHDGPTIMPSPTDYDLADGDERNEDFASNPYIKRRRAGESPFSGLTARFGTRFPSFSQGWRRRRAGSTISITESCPSPSLRVNTSRASSVVGSPIEASERQDYQLPPTPARSVFDGNDGKSMPAPIDIQKAKAHDDVEDVEGTATTPLLPPMMAQFASQFKEEPLQSPLQSPTVAEFDSSTPVHSPISAPQQPGIPSPPLSTKPSISSFHRQRCPNPLIPSSEIPPILTADPNDEWANKLGHANFTIYPEPYLPYHFDLNACKHLRAEWDLARCNYVKHLMRTGEHYGATSKIYKFTEEKWSEVDAQWKKNSEHCISRTADNGETSLSLSQSSIAEPAPLMKLPSLNGPHSEGKFPKRGDEDIVGPMEQIASQLQRRPSKKAAFLKFLQGVFAGERSP